MAAALSIEPLPDNERQSFRQTTDAAQSHGTDRRSVARISSRSLALETGDYGNSSDGEFGISSNHPGKASRARRSFEHRRFRHRLLVIELSQSLPRRHVEDR